MTRDPVRYIVEIHEWYSEDEPPAELEVKRFRTFEDADDYARGHKREHPSHIVRVYPSYGTFIRDDDSEVEDLGSMIEY